MFFFHPETAELDRNYRASRLVRQSVQTNSIGLVSVVFLLLCLVQSAFANHPFVPWPDHNYTTSNPTQFEADRICDAGEVPTDGCWFTLPGLGDATFAIRGNESPASSDITSGNPDGSVPSMFFSYQDDLSGYSQAIQDAYPEGVVFVRMRLRGSPLRNNVPSNTPYGSQASWNFIFDVTGNGWGNFFAQTYGVNNLLNMFYNDSITSQLVNNPGTSCQAGGDLLWQHTAARQPGSIGCNRNSDAYCDLGHTRVINKQARAATAGQDYLLDMQFPLHAFRSCRDGDVFVPPSGGQGVRGDLLLQADQPFMLCASTSTQDGNVFLKDFSTSDPTYDPGPNQPLACSDPCTLTGGCEEGIIILETGAVCGTGTNSSPVELTTRVISTIDQVGGVPVSTVEKITFEYWQVGVSTQWQEAISAAGSANPVTEPSAEEINKFLMDWDTTMLDLSTSTLFQIRVIGEDVNGNLVAETQLEYNIGTCDGTAVPVTLAHFSSNQQGGTLNIEWATAMEMANLGFNIYGESHNGKWYPLNNELIESHEIDSNEPQFYEFTTRRADIRRLFLEDIDTRGIPELHGPFVVGESVGQVPVVDPIDWASVRSQNNLQRNAARTRAWRHQDRDPVRLLVDRDGLYRVGYEDLLVEGMDLSGVPVAHIAITNQGESVPFYTEAQGRFGPGDFLEFHAEGLSTLYTDSNVYILDVDNRSSARVHEENAKRVKGAVTTTYMDSVRIAREQVYAVSAVTESPWYDTRMRVTSAPRDWDFDFTVSDLVPGESRLDLQLFGITSWVDVSPDHHVQVSVNGQLVDDRWFDGWSIENLDIKLPAGLLRKGSNRLTIRLPADTGVAAATVGLSSFTVHYPRSLKAKNGSLSFTSSGRLFQVTNLTNPNVVLYRIDQDGSVARIRGVEIDGEGPYTATFAGTGRQATYLIGDPASFPVPGIEPGWSSTDITTGRADYLIISHPGFIAHLQPLIDFHQRQGRVVKVVDINDIYDQFGHGIVDPFAIQAYIRATAASMGFGHVLLVGGDTYDYKNNLGSDSISFIPSIYASTSVWSRFTPVDALYVDLNGNNVPDLPIGRLPVRTPTELHEIINKTLEYAQRDYSHTAVLASDKQEPGVSFANELDAFSAAGLSRWDTKRAHLDDMGLDAARGVLIDGINEGASLTAYLGHSGFNVWSFSGLFSTNDVVGLSNFGRPTAVAQWGCWNTYHVIPSFNTMGHSFLLSEDRGAAVVVGSAGYSFVQSGRALGERLIPRLTRPGLTVGQALTDAKQDLASSNPEMRDAILGWTILGDPAVVIGD